jgi:DNA-binding GntR family transcriptional regulator
VTKFGNEDAEQIFEIRIEVEATGILFGRRKVTAKEIARVMGSGRQGEARAESQQLEIFFENHLAYRRKVWDHLRAYRFLKETLERLVRTAVRPLI